VTTTPVPRLWIWWQSITPSARASCWRWLEYQTGALSQPVAPTGDYPLGNVDYNYAGFYLQLIWAANILNVGYYGWRSGSLTELNHPDGTLERPDPWQTAGTIAFQYYFSLNSPMFEYTRATGPDGMAHVYRTLFGNHLPRM